jgi:branched-chain amino acid aminotransferase
VMSHVLHYGSSIFEGIRCYSTKQGPARRLVHGDRGINPSQRYGSVLRPANSVPQS